MTTFLLLFLMIFTIGSAFVLGIALGYWVICGILNFFSPARLSTERASTPVLATTPSGD
jgi:hypothetical protein